MKIHPNFKCKPEAATVPEQGAIRGRLPRRVRARWRDKDIVMLTHESCVHLVGTPPHRRAKWKSVPYVLPNGQQGVWWQPYLPVRYQALDLGYSRARHRLAQVSRPNKELSD